MIANYLQSIVFFSLLAGISSYTAKKWGFYCFPHHWPNLPITFRQVILPFTLYLILHFLLAPYLFFLLLLAFHPSFEIGGLLQLIISLSIMLVIFLGFRNCKTFAKIWKQRNRSSFGHDVGLGILTWFVAFPIVIAVGQLVDLLLYLFHGWQEYEQSAVQYLKSGLNSPLQLVIALFSILIIAPTLEEFLFRGSLQNYLKKWIGIKWAIPLTAICFAGFHFTYRQGLGNLSIIASLFVFACFLGFIYERQGSLFSSIALHVTFNLANSCRVLLFPSL